MVNCERYLITSALPYANGPLHIGHLAGAYLPADIYVRFLRLQGKDVVYVCGSDEHGAAITMRAIKDDTTPQSVVDKYHEMFMDSFDKMGISFDIYHRTSSDLHHETAQSFFKNLYDKGEFLEKTTEQYFDEEAGQFLADRYIKGTCPKCSYTEAYGDQCENCGSTLSPTELINPASTLTGSKPIIKETSHWYLPLDKYEPWLREWTEKGTIDGKEYHVPAEWKNHVLGQIKSWLDSGLQPRSMTRDLDWGVDVPHDVPGHEGKKLYVWMDAPIGYVSATKQWAADHGKDWKDYWQDPQSTLVHFIGKDNIVFHCLIFPAILRAHGDYNLPYNVPANQFMNLEGQKISTSRNWAVWVHEYVEQYPNKIDELRYCMIKNMPELKDSEFTWKSYQDANNNELVANMANFVNRVIVLTNKYYDGKVPQWNHDHEFTGSSGQELDFVDGELFTLFDAIYEIQEKISSFDFRGGLTALMDLCTKGNQLLQYNEPWKLIKEDEETTKTIMSMALHYVYSVGVACKPFLPFASDKIMDLLNLPHIEAGHWVKMTGHLSEGEALFVEGHKVNKPLHLFTRIDDSVIEAEVAKLQASLPDEPEEEASPVKPEITFDDFTKLDIRTATIIAAEKVEKADKLLKLELDLGFEKRTVVSGIAQHYTTEEVIGKRVSLLANLAPRKIRGVESKGMILMAEDTDGKLGFVSPPGEWQDGSNVS